MTEFEKRTGAVLELEFLPGEYLCTWHVLGIEGETIHLPGSLTIRPNRSVVGAIHGKVPIEGKETAPGQTVFDLVQRREQQVFRASLANGGAAILLSAQVTWMLSQGSVTASTAVLRRQSTLFPWQEHEEEAAPNEEILFDRIHLQVVGLDAVSGIPPIGALTIPRSKDDRGVFRWVMETNPSSDIKWNAGNGDRAEFKYRWKATAANAYSFRLRFSPVITVTPARSASMSEMYRQWIEPARGILSVATGKSQAITYLALSRPGEGEDEPLWQVYGREISQAPYESDLQKVRDSGSVLFLEEDGMDLLSMLQGWQGLVEEHHPLIETYASMLHVQDQHPRSRFLLLVQSLEGMYGHVTASEYEKSKEVYAKKRTELLEEARGKITGRIWQFLKSNLAKSPQRNLETALGWAFNPSESLHPQILAELANSKIVRLHQAEDSNLNPMGAVRITRNDLAHGTRGYDAQGLDEVNQLLEKVVRAHALNLLGCPEKVTERLFREP